MSLFVYLGTEGPFTATQWNAEKLNGYECKDHKAVRGTSYIEVARILDTAGCSRHDGWTWSVMGAIEMTNGIMFICPGEWVVEIGKKIMVFTDGDFRRTFNV